MNTTIISKSANQRKNTMFILRYNTSLKKCLRIIFFSLCLIFPSININAKYFYKQFEDRDTIGLKRITTIPLDLKQVIILDTTQREDPAPIKLFNRFKFRKNDTSKIIKSNDCKNYNLILCNYYTGGCIQPIIIYSLFKRAHKKPLLVVTIVQQGTCKEGRFAHFSCGVLKKDCPTKPEIRVKYIVNRKTFYKSFETSDTTALRKITTIPLDLSQVIILDTTHRRDPAPIKLFNQFKLKEYATYKIISPNDCKNYHIISCSYFMGGCNPPIIKYSLFKRLHKKPLLVVTIIQPGTCKVGRFAHFSCLVLKKDCPIRPEIRMKFIVNEKFNPHEK